MWAKICWTGVSTWGSSTRIPSGGDCDGLQANRRRTGRWLAVDAPHLVALVRAGAIFHKGKLLERPGDITPTQAGESTETEVA